MKFRRDYQNDWKGKHCDHVYSTLDDNYGNPLQRCIKCYRFIENREKEY